MSNLFFGKLLVVLMAVATQSVCSQFISEDDERDAIQRRSYSDISKERIRDVQGQQDPEMDRYNRFLSKDILIFIGAGYSTENFDEIYFSQLKNHYNFDTKNNIPPLTVGTEYALTSFLSLGSEFNFFKFTANEGAFSDSGAVSLFAFKSRLVFHYSFSRVNLYLGGTAGGFVVNIFDDPLLGNTKLGGIVYSIFTGCRVFFADTFFIYAETAIPFPMVMGGVGVKL